MLRRWACGLKVTSQSISNRSSLAIKMNCGDLAHAGRLTDQTQAVWGHLDVDGGAASITLAPGWRPLGLSGPGHCLVTGLDGAFRGSRGHQQTRLDPSANTGGWACPEVNRKSSLDNCHYQNPQSLQSSIPDETPQQPISIQACGCHSSNAENASPHGA